MARYSLHYSPALETLMSNPLATTEWPHGTQLPLAAGSETSFTLDFSLERSLLDQPLYFAMFAYSSNYHGSSPGPVSNVVRVLVPSPPPPPPPAPTDYTGWFNRNKPDVSDDNTPIHKIAHAEFGLEFILPIAGGVLLLLVCLIIYCYFCLARRRHAGVNKGQSVNKHYTVLTTVVSICDTNSVLLLFVQANNHPSHLRKRTNSRQSTSYHSRVST